MPKIRIEFDKATCIGNKACLAMDFKRWKDVGDKVDLIGGKEIQKDIFILEGNYSEDEIETIVEGAKVCPVNAIGVRNLDTKEELYKREITTANMKEVRAKYDDRKEFIGKTPIEIYQTIINREKLKLRDDHYAYLGRELQKAYISLQNNLKYVQDDELNFKKKA